jgi:hypothetical protein
MTMDYNYEALGTLFPHSRAMHEGIARAYMTSHGTTDDATVREFFRQSTDAELAQECWTNYGLTDDPEERRAMSANPAPFSLEELTWAMEAVRKEFA